MINRTGLFKTVVAGAMAIAIFGVGAASAADLVGLITKTEGNPFFVKMREGAQAKAKELGLDLQTYAGKYDGDNETQVAAIESLIAAGAKGFAIVPSDSSAIVPTIKKARDAGLMVIVLDTPLDPMDAADATFATDNRKAGKLIGEWAKGTLGDKAKDAKIAFLDLSVNQPTVDYLRDQGFMQGFGIDVKDPNHYGDETDPRICGHEMSSGAEDGGRTAMEKLLQKCPDVNVMYTINEPAAAGGYEAHQGGRQGRRCAGRVDRRRLPGREERPGRRHRRHVAAIPAQDGLDGAGGDRLRQAARRRLQGRLLRHRRAADHRQAGGRRPLDQHRGRPEALLGLIPFAAITS